MRYVDVHAHLDFPEFDADREALIADCGAQGVKVIVVNGTDPESNRRVQSLAEVFPLLKPAFGFYPVTVYERGLDAVKEELAWIEANRPVAIGEVGLDYKVADANGELHKDVQRAAFREIVRLAMRLDVPVIVHSRKAESDVLDILEEENVKKVVLHCFMGKRRLVERARDLGFSFSVPVSVVKLEQLQWLVQNVPLKQLLTETDAPYLGPVPGERNDPRNVSLSVEKIAELNDMTSEEVANIIFMNYQGLFL